jgi:hypothetical protein
MVHPRGTSLLFLHTNLFSCSFLMIGSLVVICFGPSVDEQTHVLLHKQCTARLSSMIDEKCQTTSSMCLPILVSNTFSCIAKHMTSCIPV